MSRTVGKTGPAGGLQVAATLRPWRWTADGELISAPLRCRREQWYLLRAYAKPGAATHCADLVLELLDEDQGPLRRRVFLHAAPASAGMLLGWVQTPEQCGRLRVQLDPGSRARALERLVLHPVAERDPKCHPLANVPRWSTCRPPFEIERVVLPRSLAALAERINHARVEIVERPRSLRKLIAKAAGSACILDPSWVGELELTLADVERVAAGAWLIVDLPTLAELLRRAGRCAARCRTLRAEHEIMSARVEYADVATRGFALQDVLPLSTVDESDGFATRVLWATQAWKRYANQSGTVAWLTSETPWPGKCHDVLSAARVVGRGELIATDLPWLAAGRLGMPLAPRLVDHLLRMHLGAPLGDWVQYWNRWDDTGVLLRDISEMPRRYPPLEALRWRDAAGGAARLGLALVSGSGRRLLMIRTGRIDLTDRHDGLPPEPLVIFMKFLARELRQRSNWARRFLADATVVWQFDAADGLKYATQFRSAATLGIHPVTHTLSLRAVPPDDRCVFRPQAGNGVDRAGVPCDAGVFGDESLDYQSRLTAMLRRWIERMHAAG